jgi:hypothetical protein
MRGSDSTFNEECDEEVEGVEGEGDGGVFEPFPLRNLSKNLLIYV